MSCCENKLVQLIQDRYQMKKNVLQVIAILIVLCFLCGAFGCSGSLTAVFSPGEAFYSNAVELIYSEDGFSYLLPVLNREVIIEGLSKHEREEPIHYEDTEVIFVLDDSSSMAPLLTAESQAYAASLRAFSHIYSLNTNERQTFAGFRMRALADSDSLPDFADNPEDFFQSALEQSTYFLNGKKMPVPLEHNKKAYRPEDIKLIQNSDVSQLGTALSKLKALAGAGTRDGQLIVLITDMLLTDSKRIGSEYQLLAREMKPWIENSSTNIGIIALKSFATGYLTPVSDVVYTAGEYVFQKFNSNKLFSGTGTRDERGDERNVYLIFLGDDSLVKQGMRDIQNSYELAPFLEKSVQSLALDDYPAQNIILPSTTPLKDTKRYVSLSSEFSTYCLPLPTDKGNSFVYSPPLTDVTKTTGFEEYQTGWDADISRNAIPFWRVWNEKAAQGTGEVIITFKTDSEILLTKNDIIISGYTIKNGATVTFDNSVDNYATVNNCSVSNDGTVRLSIYVSQSKLDLNVPVLFHISVPLGKEMHSMKYEPTLYQERYSWVSSLNMDWQSYYRNAYDNGSSGQTWAGLEWQYLNTRNLNANGYSVFGQTPFIEEFINSLFVMRQAFINDSNVSYVNMDTIQQFCFGFVKRQVLSDEMDYIREFLEARYFEQTVSFNYPDYFDKKDGLDENVGYAFSENEKALIQEMLDALNNP